MATIEFSSGLMTGISERISVGNLSQTVLTTNSTFVLTPIFPYDFYETDTSSGNEIVSYLKIYSGTVPTLNDLSAYNSRDADALISYEIRLTDVFDTSVLNTNPIVINTDFVSATNSGTATWFRLYSYRGTNLIHQIVGTVGLLEDSVDLKLGDTSIVSSVPYKISNFRILFPSTFTY